MFNEKQREEEIKKFVQTVESLQIFEALVSIGVSLNKKAVR